MYITLCVCVCVSHTQVQTMQSSTGCWTMRIKSLGCLGSGADTRRHPPLCNTTERCVLMLVYITQDNCKGLVSMCSSGPPVHQASGTRHEQHGSDIACCRYANHMLDVACMTDAWYHISAELCISAELSYTCSIIHVHAWLALPALLCALTHTRRVCGCSALGQIVRSVFSPPYKTNSRASSHKNTRADALRN